MFLAVISYVLGIFMETVIPRRGFFRFLNPVNQVAHIYPPKPKRTFAGSI